MHSSEFPDKPTTEDPGAVAREARRLELLRARSGGRGPALPRPEQPSTYQKDLAERSNKFRKIYLEKNSGDTEGADIAAGLIVWFENTRKLDSREVRDKEAKFELVRKQAEFNGKWTDYIYTHSNNESFLVKHWKAMEHIAIETKNEMALRMLRSGIVNQVATLRIFKALGMPCSSSSVQEDAMDGIDYWLEPDSAHDKNALQVKSSSDARHVEIVEMDSASPLYVTVNGGEKTTLVSSSRMDEILKFRIKLDRYAARINAAKGISGLFITIPSRMFDRITGKPSQELLEEVAVELRRLKHLPENYELPLATVA